MADEGDLCRLLHTVVDDSPTFFLVRPSRISLVDWELRKDTGDRTSSDPTVVTFRLVSTATRVAQSYVNVCWWSPSTVDRDLRPEEKDELRDLVRRFRFAARLEGVAVCVRLEGVTVRVEPIA